jgi:aldehyde dehydrogenase (NAD+)
LTYRPHQPTFCPHQFPGGNSARTLAWRREQLRNLDRLLGENIPAIEKAVGADLGKHPLETYLVEVGSVRSEIALTLKNLTRWTRARRVSVPLWIRPAGARIQRRPLGTVLIIAPWNYPVHLLLVPLVGAIAAGNSVVVKPSELAPETSALMARLFPKYLDPRAVSVVEGAVEETTKLLTFRWDHIFYTGNGTVGRIVMAAAAKHLTPVTLELGGKSPVFVDDTADIDAAAGWLAWGKLLNSGQTCVAPEYVMASASVVPRLVAALRKDVREAFLSRTSSGSMGINVSMLQLGVPTLPFGGVGASGMGAYHGEHSVRAFSHDRAVLHKHRGPNLASRSRPPFTEGKQRMLRGKSGKSGKSGGT